jgi:hypothetical protein
VVERRAIPSSRLAGILRRALKTEPLRRARSLATVTRQGITLNALIKVRRKGFPGGISGSLPGRPQCDLPWRWLEE